MRFILFFLILIGSIHNVLGQGNWELLTESPEIEHFAKRYDDIYFLNDSVGFAGNTDGQILLITDFGDSIKQVYSGNEKIRTIEFLNDSVGFAGTLEGDSFLRTLDYGSSWTNIGDRINSDTIQVCGLSKADETIFAVGKWAGPAYVFKSEDLGESWNVFDLSNISNGLTDAHFFNASHGFVVGNSNYDSLGGAIFETTDGGETWNTIHTTNVLGDFIWKIQFVNDSIGFGSVQSFFGTNKRILKTLDGGTTWNSLTVIENDTSDFTFQGVGFVNDTLGWVGGWGNGLYQTIDGGISWELLSIGGNYNRFFPRSPNLVYASGNRLYKYTDTLNLTTPDTTRIVLSSQFENHKRNQLIIYPNPVKGVVNIELNLSVRTFIDLKIYDLNGRILWTISRKEMQNGTHNFSSDVSHLRPGALVIGLKTSEGYYFTKLIVE